MFHSCFFILPLIVLKNWVNSYRRNANKLVVWGLIFFTHVVYATTSSPGFDGNTVVRSDSHKVIKSIKLNHRITRHHRNYHRAAKHHHLLRQSKHKSVNAQLSSLTFNLHYSGDISGVVNKFTHYDSHLLILEPIGTPKKITVSFDLQSVTIKDVADVIANQTNGRVVLLYDDKSDAIRLNYTGKMDVGQDAVKESLKWQDGGNPKPVLKQDGVVRFPYGEYQPIVTCEPLNLCDIELEAGEEIQGIVIGDSQRWNEGDKGIPVVYSGEGNKLTPHLVLKPSQGGLETTLMITTSKRTYMIKLRSREEGYVARAGFYYPTELIQQFETNKNTLRHNVTKSDEMANSVSVKMPLINLSHANYQYTIKGNDYSWKPTQVFDDGTSVYVQLPDGVSSRDLPGFCIVPDNNTGSDQCEMVNFRYNDHFYIIDKLFDKAKLVNGFGDHAQIITILRNPTPSGFWARLFGAHKKH